MKPTYTLVKYGVYVGLFFVNSPLRKLTPLYSISLCLSVSRNHCKPVNPIFAIPHNQLKTGYVRYAVYSLQALKKKEDS